MSSKNVKKHGIKEVNRSVVHVGRLHFQICPWAHNPELWNGNNSASVVDSPHVDFLRLRIKEGKKTALKTLNKTRYCRMYEYWDEVRYGGGNRIPSYIKKKAKSLFDLFDSIRKKGFDNRSRIKVLKKPLWISRGLSGGDHLQSPEIFHGHHRVACLYVLGIKQVDVDMCKDTLSGSLSWPQKLSRMKQYEG